MVLKVIDGYFGSLGDIRIISTDTIPPGSIIPMKSYSGIFGTPNAAKYLNIQDNPGIRMNGGIIFAPLGPLVPYEIRNACQQLLDEGCLNLLLGNSWIAGGAIRSKIDGTESNDLDCYFGDEQAFANTKRYLIDKNYPNVASVYHEDPTVCSIIGGKAFKHLVRKFNKIDLIKRSYGGDPKSCLENFDFTCCSLAMDRKRNVYWHPNALIDIHSRKLVLTNPKNIAGTLLRINKYGKKGYGIDVSEIKKIVNIVRSANEQDIWDELARISEKSY